MRTRTRMGTGHHYYQLRERTRTQGPGTAPESLEEGWVRWVRIRGTTEQCAQFTHCAVVSLFPPDEGVADGEVMVIVMMCCVALFLLVVG